MVLAELLRGDGFETVIHDQPEAALHALDEERFDVVVSDLEMPGIDGFGVLAKARAIQPSAKLFLVTGKAGVLNTVPCGAVVLSKPLDYARLLGHLRREAA